MSFDAKSPASSSVIGLALMILGMAGAAIASIDPTERWVHTQDEGWCLIFGVYTICLPTDYSPTTFKQGFAEFRSQRADSDKSIVDYESSESRTLLAQVDSLLESDVWVVGNTQYHDLLTIVEVSPSDSQLNQMHGATMYILSFEDQFTLKIHGRSSEENEKLARAILAQWQKESSYK